MSRRALGLLLCCCCCSAGLLTAPWVPLPIGTGLAAAVRSPCVPRATVPPTCAAASGAPRGRRRPTDAALLRAALRPAVRLITAIRSVVARVADALRALFGTMPAEPDAPVVLSSLLQFCEVVGESTRTVPPPDPVLVYFNYGVSPFYTQLSDESNAAEASTAASSGGSASLQAAARASTRKPTPVRWLQHRFARPPCDFATLSMQMRMDVLRELYTEAQVRRCRSRADAMRHQSCPLPPPPSAPLPSTPLPLQPSARLPCSRCSLPICPLPSALNPPPLRSRGALSRARGSQVPACVLRALCCPLRPSLSCPRIPPHPSMALHGPFLCFAERS